MTSPDSELRCRLALDETDIARRVEGLAAKIRERYRERMPCFVGIETRGVPLARRVRRLLENGGGEIPLGTLDISLYRDDLDNLGTMPRLKESDLPFSVDGVSILLFDDVLFTGRTVKAAIDAITDFGRPERIELAVLIDRGNRELPIQADYVGKELETTRDHYVRVRLWEVDGAEGVEVLSRAE
ncbi:MAG TPA: bifunctional pyr operon transcriptional regulator/uracil phosphoribosyltransferase PyrR [Verrucomicrobiales bacterium]|nr:bifunctional pyr operon transcriptional regulator/uracil phosphoribosyltransferase PyrR [Verrucomicrobiales bacterium]